MERQTCKKQINTHLFLEIIQTADVFVDSCGSTPEVSHRVSGVKASVGFTEDPQGVFPKRTMRSADRTVKLLCITLNNPRRLRGLKTNLIFDLQIITLKRKGNSSLNASLDLINFM